MERIVERRLRGQMIAGRARSVVEVVRGLGAVQAQDYLGMKWAVGMRARVPDEEVERAIAAGEVLRLHLFRWTWQLVAAEDVGWMLGLVGARVSGSARGRYAQLGLGEAVFRRARGALEKALADGAELTRAEVARVLDAARVPTGPRLAHVLGQLELEGRICSGGRRGKQATYAWLARRVGTRARQLEGDEARAELATRYFASRGPATLADFGWWSGLTVADMKRGIDGARGLVAERVGGVEHWRADSAPPARARRERAHLLPPFDEYLVAYKKRDAVLDPRHVRRVNAGGGLLAPVVIFDGRVVATWKRRFERRGVVVTYDWLERRPGPDVRGAVEEAEARYRVFLGAES